MKNQCRLLLLRSQHHISTHSIPTSRFFSSHPPHFLTPQIQNSQNPSFFRHFSSSLQQKDADQVAILTNVFSKPLATNDQITLEVDTNDILVTHDLILSVLKTLNASPDVARKFFDWVSEAQSDKLSSKSYNFMLGVLGVNGLVNEFWDLVGIMKKKGYGVHKGTYAKISEKFESGELDKLKELFASGSAGNSNSVQNLCSRVCNVIGNEVWGDDVEKKLRDLNLAFSSDLIEMVLENLAVEPNKALIFFRWVEESGLFKHEERTYNSMARVLGREDCVEKFWRVVDEMRGAGCEMEIGTYIEVVGRFVKSKAMKDAVDLYEFAMGGVNKPSGQECTFLLRKIVVSKELDMDLFSRVVRVYKDGWNSLTNSTLDAVFKSITSVGRFGECNKVLKAMEVGGLLPNGTLQCKIAYQLGSDGKEEEASEFMDNMEASGSIPDNKTWVSLVEGYYVAGQLDKASECFQKMVKKEGTSCAGYALELLVTAYCSKNRAVDACKLLCDMVNEKELKPWRTTYKVLVNKLLVQGGFKQALELLGLMKSHGYPPFLEPFVEYISKTGTADDSVMFLKAMTVKRFPSTAVFLRMFEAYFKAGRHSEAQDFLSKCPGYIRNHADVLNMFCAMKSSGEAAATTAVAA